ncbi:MAG: sugar phosphate isomerase/epimerase family protein [Verrucomicrobiales bacterium]
MGYDNGAMGGELAAKVPSPTDETELNAVERTTYPATFFMGMKCGTILAAMLLFLVGMSPAREPAAKAEIFSSLGCAAKPDSMKQVKESGADFVTVSTADFLCPEQSEEVFEKNLAKAREAGLQVLACNGFLQKGKHTVVGPESQHDAAVAWAEIVCRRLAKAGGKFVVFGSSSARRIPKDWTKEQADEQMVALLKRLGPVAEKHGVTIVVEQLRKEECNFLNHINHLGELIRKADHPHVKALADLYHMASVGDTPEDLKRNLDVVVQMEIAEKDGRSYPGIKGDDFRPWFRVLAKAGWKGAINIEGRGEPSQLAPAFREIRKQEAEAIAEGN